ncbi:MAG: OmpA family protein [Planctomycetota bacterium]
MSSRRSNKLLVVVAIWLLLAGVVAIAFRVLVSPALTEGQAFREALSEYTELSETARKRGLSVEDIPEDADAEGIVTMIANLERRLTSSRAHDRPIRQRVGFSLDSFSGYAVFRSDAFAEELASAGLALELHDDGADYNARLRSLQQGTRPVAIFTIDALIKASAGLRDLPATIVLVLDETVGADAMVSYSQGVPDIDALNRPDARIVVTPDSPSETLTRVVMANFALPDLPQDPWVAANGAAEVYDRFVAADPTQPQAFVLWEPYVSKALEQPGATVLLDSSNFRGYIVDVLVVQRQFLLDHEETVRQIVQSYLKTAHRLRHSPGAWSAMLREDARKLGEPLTVAQAERMLDTIWWKNTRENYAHFSLLPGTEVGGVRTLHRIVKNLTDVLQETGAIAEDPTDGQPGALIYERVMRQLQTDRFHPDGSRRDSDEGIRDDQPTRELSDREWASLVPVGTLDVDRLVFARGTSALTGQTRRSLDRLRVTLQDWPHYYLVVEGQARQLGDTEANRALAVDRAEAARDYLEQAGVPTARMLATTREQLGRGGTAQSVTFRLMQLPY